jgi:hypothetical protein
MKAISGLLFILILNVLFTFVNLGIADIRGDDTLQLGVDSSLMDSYNVGTSANPVLKTFNEDELPSSEGTVTTGDNPFTDLFLTISKWFKTAGQGLAFLFNMVNAVPNFLQSMGLSGVVLFTLGVMWHLFAVFLIIMFWRGD